MTLYHPQKAIEELQQEREFLQELLDQRKREIKEVMTYVFLFTQEEFDEECARLLSKEELAESEDLGSTVTRGARTLLLHAKYIAPIAIIESKINMLNEIILWLDSYSRKLSLEE